MNPPATSSSNWFCPPLPDYHNYHAPQQKHIDSFRVNGIPVEKLIHPAFIRRAVGTIGHDRRFDDDLNGSDHLAFREPEDFVYWNPETNKFGTWNGRAFALGECNIWNAGIYALDGKLSIYSNISDWLRDDRRGLIVLDWNRAFDKLRDCPRIEIQECLLPTYRKYMRPSRLPD
ncbi:MAG: hypothetical protein GY761_06655, partial [Hyphomicrobiales bacterium]|nr:hypothetical protein [Hyphomicrobiales bacterium]